LLARPFVLSDFRFCAQTQSECWVYTQILLEGYLCANKTTYLNF